MKLLCIDGNSVLNRAFYAIKLLTTKDGHFTNAIFGFMNIFTRLLDSYKPDAVAVAFDVREKTFRHKMYDGYKATRKGMPAELAEQLPTLQELLKALGYAVITAPGYEADDILGTLSAMCDDTDWDCFIATGDRDSLQLISEHTHVLLTTTHFGRGETEEMTRERFAEQYGTEPVRLIDIKSLMGDSSDNIPGVSGVGEKTALALIRQFGTLDGVYENIDSPDIKLGVRKKLIDDKENAYMSYTLATINRAVPLGLSLDECLPAVCDSAKASSMLTSLEMFSMIKKLGLNEATAAMPEVKEEKALEREPEYVEICELEDDYKGNLYILNENEAYYATDGARVFSLTPQQLVRIGADESITKYVYSAKQLYELSIELGEMPRNIAFDISLAAYLLNPSASDYGFSRLCAEYSAKASFICEQAHDTGMLKSLADKLKALIEQTDMSVLLNDIELPLSRVLAEMQGDGFLVDTEGIRRFGEQLSMEIQTEEQHIYDLVGRRFNINSPKQLGDALFVDLGLPSGKKTKSGYSTNAEVLDGLRGVHPVIDHILLFRTYQKLSSTYVEGLLRAADREGRIHTRFQQTETRTGRISSTNPNLQNIPVRTEIGSKLRSFFAAKPGYVLLDADYSQIELRVLAHISNDEKMISAFRDGRDIHTETASEIFKLPRNMITPELRRRAKAVNFGIVYGIGAFSLAKDVGVTMTEASHYIGGYMETYSDVKKYLDETVEKAKKDGYVTTMYGRRRMLPELSASNRNIQALGKRLAMNTPIQGSAADIIKLAMIRVSDSLAFEGLDARLILQVHDELIVEASESDAARAKEVLVREMQNVVELKAPLVVNVGEGNTWYDAK